MKLQFQRHKICQVSCKPCLTYRLTIATNLNIRCSCGCISSVCSTTSQSLWVLTLLAFISYQPDIWMCMGREIIA